MGFDLKHILVGVDETPQPWQAAYYASRLAALHGSQLMVMHVVADTHTPFAPLRRRLKPMARSLFGGQLSVMLARGKAAVQLAEMARRRHADLLVVGSHHHSKWQQALFGSTTAQLVSEAPCPVLSVWSADAGVVNDALPHLPPAHRIVVPIRFDEESLTALRYAASLGESEGSRLIVLHVVEDINDSEKAAHARLEGLVRDLAIGHEIHVVRGRAADAIIHLADAAHADLICLASHGRSGLPMVLLGSTAAAVLRRAPCPVLVLRGWQRPA